MRDDQLEQSRSLSWVFHASLHVGGDRSALSLLFSSKLSWNFSWGPSIGHPFMELFMELSWKANLSLSTFMLHFRGILSTRPACGQAKKSAWCDFRAKMHTFVMVEPQPISEEWSGPRYQLLRCDFRIRKAGYFAAQARGVCLPTIISDPGWNKGLRIAAANTARYHQQAEKDGPPSCGSTQIAQLSSLPW